MSNLKNYQVISFVFVGLLVALALAPQWTQARVNETIASPADDGEGDPLDSNDYSSRGDGDTADNDLHADTSVTETGDLCGRVLLSALRRGNVVFLPFLHGSILNVQVIELPMRHAMAVEHAD